MAEQKIRHCTEGLGAETCLDHALTVLAVAHSQTMGPLLKAKDEGEQYTEHLIREARALIDRAEFDIKAARACLETVRARETV